MIRVEVSLLLLLLLLLHYSSILMTTTNEHYLIAASVAPTTHLKYTNALNKFQHYLLRRHNYKLNDLHSRPALLDSLLVEYLHYLYESTDTIRSATVGNYTIAGLVRHFGVSNTNIHRSRLAVRGWDRIYSQHKHKRPPVTLEVATLIAVVLAKAGHHKAAVATLLAFHCYLRINEYCKLKVHEVVFAGDSRMGSAMTVLATIKLSRTKTGDNQNVSVTDVNIVALLKNLVNNAGTGTGRSSLLFELTASQYRRLFHQAVSALGLDDIGYKPHSLRHGGATFHYMSGVPLLSIINRGRWASEKSLKTYINAGTVFLMDGRLSDTLFEAAQLLYKHICVVLYSLQSS